MSERKYTRNIFPHRCGRAHLCCFLECTLAFPTQCT